MLFEVIHRKNICRIVILHLEMRHLRKGFGIINGQNNRKRNNSLLYRTG